MTHTDTASAVVAAGQLETFAALVDADARAAWLPPAGMSGRFDWFDARTGGGYRMVLSYDDPATTGKSGANTDIAEARFAQIQPPSIVVEEVDFVSDDPRFAGTMTMTWTVEGVADGAHVTITATDVPDGISAADHATAFASTLANLDAYLRAR
jgi:uncharacterized protein YndB with AHSA1/START domain